MGFFMTWHWSGIILVTPEMRLLVATGFLGSYTTLFNLWVRYYYLAEQSPSYSICTLPSRQCLNRDSQRSVVLCWLGWELIKEPELG